MTFSDAFFLGALRVKLFSYNFSNNKQVLRNSCSVQSGISLEENELIRNIVTEEVHFSDLPELSSQGHVRLTHIITSCFCSFDPGQARKMLGMI